MYHQDKGITGIRRVLVTNEKRISLIQDAGRFFTFHRVLALRRLYENRVEILISMVIDESIALVSIYVPEA